METSEGTSGKMEVGGSMIFEDMINIAQRAKTFWEAETREAQKKLQQSKVRIQQLEEENAQFRSQALHNAEELAAERKRADDLLEKEATLSDLLKSREQDLDEQKEKIQICEEKLLQSKKLYDNIVSQMISLKQSIASSRKRLHNRGGLEDFNSRIDQVLVSAGNAVSRLQSARRADSAPKEKENFVTDQTALIFRKSLLVLKPTNMVSGELRREEPQDRSANQKRNKSGESELSDKVNAPHKKLEDVDQEIDKSIRARESNRESTVQPSAADEYQDLAGSPVLGPVRRPVPLCKDLSDEVFADTSAFSPVLVRGEAIPFGPMTPNTGKEKGSQKLQSPRCSQSTSQNSPILFNIGSKQEQGKEAKNIVEDAAVELSADATGILQQKKDFRINENAEKLPQRSRMSPIREDISSVSKDAIFSNFPPKFQATGESCSLGSRALQTKIQDKIPQRSLGKRSVSIYGVHEDYSADFMKQKRQRLPLNRITASECGVAGTVGLVTDSSVATSVTMRRSDTMPESLGAHSRNVSRDVRGKQARGGEALFNEVIRNRQERMQLKATTCSKCSNFFSKAEEGLFRGLGGRGASVCQCSSRHRHKCTPPATPPGFWAVGGVGSSQEGGGDGAD